MYILYSHFIEIIDSIQMSSLKAVVKKPAERRLDSGALYVTCLLKPLPPPAAPSSPDAASTDTLLCEKPVDYKWNGVVRGCLPRLNETSLPFQKEKNLD